jgi:hypothetical protein
MRTILFVTFMGMVIESVNPHHVMDPGAESGSKWVQAIIRLKGGMDGRAQANKRGSAAENMAARIARMSSEEQRIRSFGQTFPK